jgi:hypothetical protein
VIDASGWEDVNAEIRTRRHRRSGLVRTSQNALLAGLLFCKSCERPMIATYTANGGRRFRYYVCQAARQNGSALPVGAATACHVALNTSKPCCASACAAESAGK